MEKVAIIDMGSNTIRMVIFQISEQTYHLIDDTKETVRLSEHMAPEQTLKPAAMTRALSALKRFMKLCRSRGVTTIIPVATAAVREAKNQQQFLELVRKELQLDFRVLSGYEEGNYGFLGVINGLAEKDGFTLDIGGGSSEVSRFEERSLRHSHSMPFGALTLTETFKDHTQENKLSIDQLRQYLQSAFMSQPWIRERAGLPLIGLGGTVRNISRIHRNLTNYPLESAHHYEMTKQQVDHTINYLSSLSMKELMNVPGLSKERADIIVAGGLIIQSLMDICGSPRLLISGNGLREGLFFEHYHRKYGAAAADDVTMNSVLNTMRYYRVDMEHARHVAFLAERLFDELRSLHGMGDFERRLLTLAALLHNVGVSVSFYDLQKHTFYVLLHSKIAGISHRERLLVALIASFKAKKKMREWVLPYQTILAAGDQDTVQKLGVLLLMARALDRALSSDVQDLNCHVVDREVQISVHSASSDIGLELREASELEQKFEKVFGASFTLIAHMLKV